MSPVLSAVTLVFVCGTEDIDICYRHFTAFFNHFAAVDANLDDADMC